MDKSYTIARGTQNFTDDDWHAIDWSYNIMGIFTGQNDSQYKTVEKFDEKVTKEIAAKIGKEPIKIGLGHSLGGNLITLLQLNIGGFEKDT